MSDQRAWRILYMEDDEALGRLMQKTLLLLGFRVDVARDGAEGVELLGRAVYDLVLVDYNMPHCDGLDVLRRIADRESCPPVIMVTGSGNESVAAEALRLGASDYAVKDPEMGCLQLLPHVINQVLHKQQPGGFSWYRNRACDGAADYSAPWRPDLGRGSGRQGRHFLFYSGERLPASVGNGAGIARNVARSEVEHAAKGRLQGPVYGGRRRARPPSPEKPAAAGLCSRDSR